MSTTAELGVSASAQARLASRGGGWRRTAVDVLLVGGTTTACHALAAVTSLLLRCALEPAAMGTWQGIKVAMGYANYANLGVSKGAAREYNLALGRGEEAEAERGLHLAFTVNTLTSLVYAAGLAAAAAFVGASGPGACRHFWQWGLFAAAGMVVVQRYTTFQVTILRCRQAFGITSRLALIEAVLALVLSAGGAWLWGIPGLCCGTILGMLAAAACTAAACGVKLRWTWNLRGAVRLAAVGAPLMLAGMIDTLFRTLDRLVILAFLPGGEHQLGCYSLALLVGAQLFGLGNVISVVMGPRYMELYGRTGDRRQVAVLAARSVELQATGLALLGSMCLVAAGPVFRLVLPAYGEGLAAAGWIVPGTIALAMALPASQFQVAVCRERSALAVLVVSTAFAGAAGWLAVSLRWGLAGVAAATSAAYLFHFGISTYSSFWRELARPVRARFAARLAIVLVPTLALAAGLTAAFPAASASPLGAAAHLACVVAAWTACLALAWRVPGPGRPARSPGFNPRVIRHHETCGAAELSCRYAGNWGIDDVPQAGST